MSLHEYLTLDDLLAAWLTARDEAGHFDEGWLSIDDGDLAIRDYGDNEGYALYSADQPVTSVSDRRWAETIAETISTAASTAAAVEAARIDQAMRKAARQAITQLEAA